MRSLHKGPRLRIALIGFGVAYPFLIYFGLGHLPPEALVLGLLAVLGAKLALDRKAEAPRVVLWIAGGAAVVLLMVAVSPLAALKSYPVIMSLGFAALFSASLLWPPTAIERIARLRQPDLPPAAIPYLRKVTLVWLVFFLANAGISIATALSGNLALWTLYNGFVAYLIMGVLFVGEMIVRLYLRPSRTEA